MPERKSKYPWLSSKLQNERLALHFTYLKYNYNIPSTQIPFLQAESYSRGDPQLKIVLSKNLDFFFVQVIFLLFLQRTFYKRYLRFCRIADILKRRLLTLCSDLLKLRNFQVHSELSNDRCPTGYRLSLLCLFGYKLCVYTYAHTRTLFII